MRKFCLVKSLKPKNRNGEIPHSIVVHDLFDSEVQIHYHCHDE